MKKLISKEKLDCIEYKDVCQLEKTCKEYDGGNLKLELEFKMNRKLVQKDSENKDEFLYYVDGELIAYIGLISFGGSGVGEVNGMCHPQHRRRGIFTELFKALKEECSRRNFRKILLICDGNSQSGKGFIESIGGEYDTSEYRMKLHEDGWNMTQEKIALRKATNDDGDEILAQNEIYFGHSVEKDMEPEDEEAIGMVTYMVELEGKTIGKIKISKEEGMAFISGVGIRPQYRGMGYGKATLIEGIKIGRTLNMSSIELDVDCDNKNALRLYIDCGFKEESVMDYYNYQL